MADSRRSRDDELERMFEIQTPVRDEAPRLIASNLKEITE